MSKRYLVDASTLIALSACGRLDLLRQVVGRVHVVTPALQEVLGDRPGAASVQQAIDAEWIKVIAARSSRAIAGLGPGEAATIAAATPDDVVVLDDRAARLEAKARGLRITGLIGLIVAGAQAGKLSRKQAIEALDDLARGNFRMTTDLYRWAMAKLPR